MRRFVPWSQPAAVGVVAGIVLVDAAVAYHSTSSMDLLALSG